MDEARRLRVAMPRSEDDTIFQHFGQTETFKVYEIIEGEDQIGYALVEGPEAHAHEATAELLVKYGVDAVVCGGIGDGMMEVLSACGIYVYSGNEGNCDDALFALLTGRIQPSNVSNCGCGCGGNCGGCGDDDEGCGCGGCGCH